MGATQPLGVVGYGDGGGFKDALCCINFQAFPHLLPNHTDRYLNILSNVTYMGPTLIAYNTSRSIS